MGAVQEPGALLFAPPPRQWHSPHRRLKSRRVVLRQAAPHVCVHVLGELITDQSSGIRSSSVCGSVIEADRHSHVVAQLCTLVPNASTFAPSALTKTVFTEQLGK